MVGAAVAGIEEMMRKSGLGEIEAIATTARIVFGFQLEARAIVGEDASVKAWAKAQGRYFSGREISR